MKVRRALLVGLDWRRPKDPPISLAQASLVANLAKHKVPHKSKVWGVNDEDFRVDEVLRFVQVHDDGNTDLALGAYVWHEKYTQRLLRSLADNFTGRIIVGGPQVSYVKEGIEEYYPEADIFVRGYGEKALVDLFTSPTSPPSSSSSLSSSFSSSLPSPSFAVTPGSLFQTRRSVNTLTTPLHLLYHGPGVRKHIAGVHYAGEVDLGQSAKVELETLPSPYLTGVIPPQRFIRWETQRGCPFKCSFCQHRQSDVSMKRKHFSASRIAQEIQWIVSNNHIINDIAVIDPTFNSGPNYNNVLRELAKGRYKGKISLQCRAEMVTTEFLDSVSELNDTACVVLEFGLQTIHKNEQRIISRPNNLKKVSAVLNETSARGIATEVSLIFGLPLQTVESFKKSVEFCKDQKVGTIHAFPLMLLRGTPLHYQKQQLGLIESSDPQLPFVSSSLSRIQDGIPLVVGSPSFSFDDWLSMAEISSGLSLYNSK